MSNKTDSPVQEEKKDLDKDQLLMVLIQNGDEDAFAQIVNKYQRALKTFCYSFIRDHAVAEDLTQEAFLRIFRHAKRYKPKAKFSTWLYRITANLCINESKKRKLRSHVSLDATHTNRFPNADGTRLINRIASSTEIPLTKLERKELGEILRKAIDALPSDQRQTLVMVEYMHMPYKEVAEVLGVSLSAIKMRIKRARESLRIGLQILGADGSEL